MSKTETNTNLPDDIDIVESMGGIKCTIYALFSLSDPGHIRYVGQTIYPIDEYVQKYFRASSKTIQSTRHISNWLKKNNFKIGYKVLQLSAKYNEDEIRWIAKLRQEGHKLCNATPGGEGNRNPKTQEQKEVFRIASQAWWTPERKAIHSKKMKERWTNNEYRQKVVNGLRKTN